jgi:hypothetical protein
VSFFCFLEFIALQAFDSQELAWLEALPKKSCLKTYHRFFIFGEMWHNRRVNMQKVKVAAAHAQASSQQFILFSRRCSFLMKRRDASSTLASIHPQSGLVPTQSDLIRPNPTNGKK